MYLTEFLNVVILLQSEIKKVKYDFHIGHFSNTAILSIYLPLYLNINSNIYLSMYLPIYLSIYLSIYQSIYLSSYLSFYLSTVGVFKSDQNGFTKICVTALFVVRLL